MSVMKKQKNKKKFIMYKRFSAWVLLTVMMLSLLTACGKTKKFTGDGITITLSEVFVKKSNPEATFYYESPDIAVLGTRTDKSDIEMSGDEDTDSLEDYVQKFISANGIKSDVEVVDKGDYMYLETTENRNGTNYAYLISFYENEDDFWVVRFACYKEAYDSFKKNIKKYAKSVTFSEED